MTWFKVDDTLAFHHKVVHAGTAAMGLWVRAGAWCAQMLTDGFVPAHMVGALSDGDATLAARLVTAGLWLDVDGGFAFHAWSDLQPSAHQVKDRRRKETERKAAWRAEQQRRRDDARVPEMSRRDISGTDDWTDASVPPWSRDGHADPDPTRPDPTRTDPSPHVGGAGGEASRKRSAATKGTRLPEDWKPDAELVSWTREHCPHVDGRHETAQFVDYWLAKSGRDAVKVDWRRTFQRWMREAEQRAATRSAPGLRAVPTTTARVDAALAHLRPDDEDEHPAQLPRSNP